MVYANISNLFSDKDDVLEIETVYQMTYTNQDSDNDDFYKTIDGDIIHRTELEQYLKEEELLNISDDEDLDEIASELGYTTISLDDWKETSKILF